MSMAKKKQPKKPTIVYADSETPIIEYADFVKLSLGIYGILFEFGQSQPVGGGAAITYQVIVPHEVARRVRQILKDQLDEYDTTTKKALEDLKDQDK